jgi:F420-dependent oxidoreductase-like protein
VRLGINLGYWSTPAQAQHNLALVQEAERLGFAVAWVSEAYSSDAVATLAWLAARTERIELGSAIMQIPARAPAMAAMTAATLDSLSRGRFRLGLGVSGPQVAEGWYGVSFRRPVEWTREYVEVVQAVLSRKPVRYTGEQFCLPLPGGSGKPLRLSLQRGRDRIPIYLASIGPRNLRLTGEVADGWLAILLDPEYAPKQLALIAEGRAAAGRTMADFDVAPAVSVAVGDDLDSCAEQLRGYFAFFLGGMGSRKQNFYNRLATRMGYGTAAATVQEHFLAMRHWEAMAAVPFELIDRTSLIGPPDRIADRMKRYADVGVTTLSVNVFDPDTDDALATLRAVAAAARQAGLSEDR